MSLANQIWKDKKKGVVNYKAFSEVAKNKAKEIDLEGRDLVTKEEKKAIKREYRNSREVEKRIAELQHMRLDNKKNLCYEDWIAELYRDGRRWSEVANKSSQIRKFYDSIFQINQRAQTANRNDDPSVILAQLHRQLALVHYARGRGLVTDSFVRMMDELLESVEGFNDLKVVTDFLESFMAYYKECRPRN